MPTTSFEENPVSFPKAGLTYSIEVSGLTTNIGLGESASSSELNSSLSRNCFSACLRSVMSLVTATKRSGLPSLSFNKVTVR